MNINEIREEYKTQDNRCTAYPIYVTVQSLICAGIMDESYGCYGESKIKYEYGHPDWDEAPFKSKDDAAEWVRESFEAEDADEIADQLNKIVEFPMLYIWTDEQVFLTIKGAEDYIARNRHNLQEVRTYVKHFSDRNLEMREVLNSIDFKIKD